MSHSSIQTDIILAAGGKAHKTLPSPPLPQHATNLLARRGIGINEVDSEHLHEDGAVAQGIPDGGEPRVQVAQNSDDRLIRGRDDQQYHAEVEDDGTDANDIVQVGAGQADQPGQGRGREKSIYKYTYHK